MPRKKITPKQYNEMAAGVRLSAHEKLCAERMKNLITSIDRLEKKVDALQDNVSKGKGIVAVLVFLGSIAAGVLGYLNFK
jgi:phage terminase large subunit-like protein